MNEFAAVFDMLDSLRQRGITCKVGLTGKLEVRRPAALTAVDRDWFRLHTAEVLELLNAINDMTATDSVVTASGVSGFHPEIQRAAEAVVSAYRARSPSPGSIHLPSVAGDSWPPRGRRHPTLR